MKNRKLKNRELGRISPSQFKEQTKTPLIVILDNIRSLNNIGSLLYAMGDDGAQSFIEKALVIRRNVLGEDHPFLGRAMALRNPYVDPLNLMQIALLKRKRIRGCAERCAEK